MSPNPNNNTRLMRSSLLFIDFAILSCLLLVGKEIKVVKNDVTNKNPLRCGRNAKPVRSLPSGSSSKFNECSLSNSPLFTFQMHTCYLNEMS